jgi:hypothetical protein
MLKTNDIHKLAKLLKVDASDLEAKINSEGEEEFTLPELQVFTNDELSTRLKNEKSTSYNEGKDAGVEMLVKDKKKELGYEFEGRTLDAFLDFHNVKLKEGSAEPDARVKELENDIKKLNSTHAEALTASGNQLNDYRGKYQNSVITNQLLQLVPKDTTIEKADIITLFKANFQTEIDENGKIQVKQNGETIKDPTTASPVDLKDIFSTFVTERKYVSATPGRGGDHEYGGGGGPKTIAGFNENWEKSGKSMMGSDYDTAYTKFREENKEVTA